MRFSRFVLFFLLICLVFPIASNAGQLEDGTTAMDQGNYERAYELLYPLAEEGDAQAQDCIATMFCEGLGVAKDEIQAVSWYEKSAEQGYAQAQYSLGAMYVNGLGVEKDVQMGLAFIVKAAQQGLEVAQQNAYGLYYEEAQTGNIGAMHNVAYMCLKGWAGETDSQNCMRLLEVAAQNGFEKSAAALAQIYTKGMFGVEADEAKAEYWKNFEYTPPEAEATAVN